MIKQKMSEEQHKEYMKKFWNDLEKEQVAREEERKKNPIPIKSVEEQQIAFDKIWEIKTKKFKTEKEIQRQIEETLRYYGGFIHALSIWKQKA